MCLSIDFDECASDPCQHAGTCHNNFARFDCDCTADWIGVTCQSKYGIHVDHVSHGRPRKIKNNFLATRRAFLLPFSSNGGWGGGGGGAFPLCGGLFGSLFKDFLGLPPLSYENLCGRHDVSFVDNAFS